MKREVVCRGCEPKRRGVTAASDPLAVAEAAAMGEGMKTVPGTAHHSMLCDACGRELPKGTPVIAVSLYSDRAPYFEWESEYLEETRRG